MQQFEHAVVPTIGLNRNRSATNARDLRQLCDGRADGIAQLSRFDSSGLASLRRNVHADY
jgi:hypothetical protein